jgi:RNA recognition motif-containing protein
MGKKLYVGGLSYDTTEETLKQTFAQAGTVESAKVIIDRDSGRSKGFGFVEMATDEEAAKAIETLNGKELDGRSLTVNEAKPMVPRENRGGGGGYRGNRY